MQRHNMNNKLFSKNQGIFTKIKSLEFITTPKYHNLPSFIPQERNFFSTPNPSIVISLLNSS